MPIRDFIDPAGVHWKVWSTVPETAGGVAGGFRQGWLTFTSTEERRRLAPIPSDWETASPGDLAAYCGRATSVKLTPPSGARTDVPEPRDGG